MNAALGYDPRPNVRYWSGTPIPPVDHPIPATPERERIARRVWWNGDPWTILRNGPRYLYAVMDHGNDEQIRHTMVDIPKSLWLLALEQARPGQLSRGAYVLWTLVWTGATPVDEAAWPTDAHRNDVPPLRGRPRESMYQRHQQHRQRRMPRRGSAVHDDSRCNSRQAVGVDDAAMF